MASAFVCVCSGYLRMERATGYEEQAQVVSEGGLTKEEFDEVAGAMRDFPASSAKGPKPKRGATPKPPVQLSQEQVELKEAMAKKRDTLKKMKALYESSRKTLVEVNGLIGAIGGKGYPESFIEHLQTKTDAVKESIEAVASRYAQEIITSESATKEAVNESVEEMSQLIATLTTKMDDAKKGVFKDVRQLGKAAWRHVA